MRKAAWTAQISCVVLVLIVPMLMGAGLFCFEDQFLTFTFDSRSIWAPDCFLVDLSDRFNPKAWLVGHIVATLFLALAAQVSAIGFFKNRTWALPLAVVGSLAATACFASMAIAPSGLRNIGIVVGVYFAVLCVGAISLLRKHNDA